MKTVLCYGDSITWGFNPVDGSRFPFDQRWPGVLQAELGTSFRVIEEGLSGRTVATESWLLPNRSGRSMLAPLLESHAPLDWVIILLGRTIARRLITATWARSHSAVPHCSGPYRRQRRGRTVECRTRSSSHLRLSESFRRSWSSSIGEAKPRSADWRQRTAPLPRHVAQVSSTQGVFSHPVRSMACIPTQTDNGDSAKRSRRS
jgi:hypothetical protein